MAHPKSTQSVGELQELIDAINEAVSTTSIASAAGTVTTALADLATERDLH